MLAISSLLGIGSLAMAVGAVAMPTARGPLIVNAPHAASHAPVRASGSCPKNALFVSDSGSGAIDIFPLKGKNQTMCGQITGFSQPGGIASDTSRHLYIANTTGSNVLVYGGPYPPGTLVRTLTDTGFFPSDVSVSASDGLVAVMNLCSAPSCGAGGVSFYKKGSTTPCNTVSTPSFARVYFGAFDAHDNVYVDGLDSSGFAIGGEISGGCSAKTISNLNLSGVTFPGGMAVDTAGNIDILDQDQSAIEAYAPGQFSKPLFSVPLPTGSDFVTFAFAASGKRIWAPSASATLGEFKYPKGGNAVNTVSGLIEPTGVAVMPVEVPGG